MALADLIVSLWGDQAASRFLCSGVHVAPGHILTVAHAFEDLAPDGQTFVCQLPGQHGAKAATLLARHTTLDAAIFKLTKPIGDLRLPLPDAIGAQEGRRPWFHAIDPDTHDVVSLDHGCIGDYDGQHCEYVIAPQTAHGYSGGLLAVGEQPIGLLNCRIENEPIARAIALAQLRPWVAFHVDRPQGPDDQAGPDYDALVALLGVRALQLLANPGTADLRRLGGFPRRAGELAGRPPRDCFETLVPDLHQATQDCLDAWRTQGVAIPRNFKADCHALLGELLKGAVDRRGRTSAELAELGAATPDRMFVACRTLGAAATVYCSITDIPLRLAEPKGALDLHGGSVIDLTDLAQGVGPDAERDAFDAVWLSYKGTPVPVDFGNGEQRLPYLNNLMSYIDMKRRLYRDDPRFLVARGPREWLHGVGLASAGERLRIGLVIHAAGSDYAYLAVEEDLLINLACEYLLLLERP